MPKEEVSKVINAKSIRKSLVELNQSVKYMYIDLTVEFTRSKFEEG